MGLFERFTAEWPLISAAPLSAITYAVIVALAIWAVLHFVYRERIEVLKEQLNLAKATGVKGPDKAKATERQAALDSLSKDLSDAIHDLLNRHTREQITDEFVTKWGIDYSAWCAKVSAKLSNRSFFTESDQIHFDRLGEVPPKLMTEHGTLNHLISMLTLKFERLREVIKLVQQRPL